MLAQSEKRLNGLMEERVSKGVRGRSLVRLGEPTMSIVEVAEEENANMIVISTHGREGWRRFLFGSVAEKVVRTASCPVLIVTDPNARSESSG
jgi:nucleotide-binding universal stress UspA family protein